MRNIIFAVAIAIGASALLFLLSTAVGVPADAAKGVASLPPFAIKNIHDFLETQSAKRMLGHTKSMVSFEEFEMRPLSVFILAVIMFVGVMNFLAVLAGYLVALAMSSHERAQLQGSSILNLIAVTALPLNVIGISYIGRWIGHRSRPLRGLAVAIASIVVGLLAVILSNAALAPVVNTISPTDNVFVEMMKQNEGSISEILFRVISNGPFEVTGILYIITIALGIWWGRRTRFLRYLAFILKVLPPETRQAIVEIARDEGLAVSGAVGRVTPEAVRV
jgi:hypothetical protein